MLLTFGEQRPLITELWVVSNLQKSLAKLQAILYTPSNRLKNQAVSLSFTKHSTQGRAITGLGYFQILKCWFLQADRQVQFVYGG